MKKGHAHLWSWGHVHNFVYLFIPVQPEDRIGSKDQVVAPPPDSVGIDDLDPFQGDTTSVSPRLLV